MYVYTVYDSFLMNFSAVAAKDRQRPHLQHTVRTAQVRESTATYTNSQPVN